MEVINVGGFLKRLNRLRLFSDFFLCPQDPKNLTLIFLRIFILVSIWLTNKLLESINTKLQKHLIWKANRGFIKEYAASHGTN